MRIRLVASTLVAALLGCAPALRAPLAAPEAQTGALTLYRARLQLALALPRRTQALPDLWDQAQVTVESAKLKTAATWSAPTATSSLAPTLNLPMGAATISVELRTQGATMATGMATASLAAGVNTLSVTMTPWVDQVVTLAGDGTAGTLDAKGIGARFNGPRGLALDGAGNVIVADTGNHMIRRITPDGVVTTVAGGATAGFLDGAGSSARFNGPSGVACDSNGNLYVADSGNNRIRMIDPAGNVTTLAGSGTAGATDGTGTGAMFDLPWGVAIDATGDILVSDFNNNAIRKIASPSMTVTTFATGLSGPSGVALDSLSNLIVANSTDSCIVKVSPSGVVSVVAGTANTTGFSGSYVPIASALFNQPRSVAVDGADNVYVADSSNYALRQILVSDVKTLAGNGTQAMTDGATASAQFGGLFGIAARADGKRIYVADMSYHRIRVLIAP